jgi:hypothetical protein
MRTNTLLLALAATLSIANVSVAQEPPAPTTQATTTVTTETIAIPAAVPAPASALPAVPARGTSMEGVKTKFGAPLQEVPPVGTPAITRWDYPGFAVFFESDKVLHTVISQ